MMFLVQISISLNAKIFYCITGINSFPVIFEFYNSTKITIFHFEDDHFCFTLKEILLALNQLT